MAEPQGDTYYGVRQMLVKETLQNWEKVIKGEQDYVMINPAYLKDYVEEVQSLGEKKAVQSSGEKKVEKKWWKFWER